MKDGEPKRPDIRGRSRIPDILCWYIEKHGDDFWSQVLWRNEPAALSSEERFSSGFEVVLLYLVQISERRISPLS